MSGQAEKQTGRPVTPIDRLHVDDEPMGVAMDREEVCAAIRVARSNVLRLQARGGRRSGADVLLAVAALREARGCGASLDELAVGIGIGTEEIRNILGSVVEEHASVAS